MYRYALQRISRSWSLFIAFFLGLTLAVSLFTGTLVGTDAMGAQTVQTALTNIPVDIVATRSLALRGSNLTSQDIDKVTRSISPIAGVTHVETLYRISAVAYNVNTNLNASFPASSGGLTALSPSSALLKDAIFSNGTTNLGIDQAIIEDGSTSSSKYSVGDTVTLMIQINQTGTSKTGIKSVFFMYNVTVVNKVHLTDSAISIVAATTGGGSIIQQLILGTQVRRPTYNLLIIDNRTLFNILAGIYSKFPAMGTLGIGVLTWLDHGALVRPWDIAQSVTDIQQIQSAIVNSLRASNSGFTASNLLSASLAAIQTQLLLEEVVFIVLALPVFFMAWYMGRTVSDVSLNLRRREIGLLQTKGFSKNQVLGLFLNETILLALVASILGLFVGVAILPLTGIEVNPLLGFQLLDVYTIAMAMIFGVVLAVISVFSPARRAANMKTVEAIREYVPEESEGKQRMRLPFVAFALGTYKIVALTIGFSPSTYRAPGGLFPTIIFGIVTFMDQILIYIGPILFFWGFAKIFIQGPFKLQELIGRLSARASGGLGEIAAKNTRLNTKRTAAVAFLLALIVGYSVSVVGGLASADDFRQRQIYQSVGADLNVQMFSPTNTTLVKSQIDNLSDVSAAATERLVSAPTSFGTTQAHVINPSQWQKAAYYEPEWFTGSSASDALSQMAASNYTIILDVSLVGSSLSVGQNITVDLGANIYNLRIVGFFGVKASSTASRLGILPSVQQSNTYWSYVPEGLYNQTNGAIVSSTRILVKEKAGVDGAKLAEQIDNLNTNIKSVDSADAQIKLIDNNIFVSGPRKVQALGLPFAALTASVGVVLLESTTLRERKKEITLTAVKGFSYGQMVKTQLLENLGILVLSILLGTLVGYVTTMGNVQSQNTAAALVMRRVVFPFYSTLTILAIIGTILAAIIVPILVAMRSYSKNLEWRIRG